MAIAIALLGFNDLGCSVTPTFLFRNRFYLPFTITIYLFIYLFTDLFKERACPQLAKANLGGPCLNKQITKKFTDKN